MENYNEQLIDELATLFDENVPNVGPAKTYLGEITRALNRVAYRFYNDGDMAGLDYGKETVDPCLAYLYKVYPGASRLIEELFMTDSHAEYEEVLTELLEVFVDELKSNKAKYKNTPNKENCVAFDTEDLYDHLDSLGIQVDTDEDEDEGGYYDFYDDEDEE